MDRDRTYAFGLYVQYFPQNKPKSHVNTRYENHLYQDKLNYHVLTYRYVLTSSISPRIKYRNKNLIFYHR